jgi:hypothetical protein
MYERLGRGSSGKHLKKKHLQRKTGAKARHIERAMSSIDESHRPVLPFEIASNILKLGLVRGHGKTPVLPP